MQHITDIPHMDACLDVKTSRRAGAGYVSLVLTAWLFQSHANLSAFVLQHVDINDMLSWQAYELSKRLVVACNKLNKAHS